MKRPIAGSLILAMTFATQMAWGQSGAMSKARMDSLIASRPELTKIRFEGNKHIDSDTLAAAIHNRQTGCPILICWIPGPIFEDTQRLDPLSIDGDLLRVATAYRLRGWRGVKVTREIIPKGPGKVEVVFRIAEGLPMLVKSIDYTGQEKVANRAGLFFLLPLKVGQPFSRLADSLTVDSIVRRLRDQGYLNAQVLQSYFLPKDSVLVAHVSYELVPGPRVRIGAVDVHVSDPATSAPVPDMEADLKRLVSIQPGNWYSDSARFETQRYLLSLEIYSDVRVIISDSTTATDSVIRMSVLATKGKPRTATVGLGFATGDCVVADARMRHANFTGKARRLDLTGQTGNLFADQIGSWCPDAGHGVYGAPTWSFSADLSQPWFLARNNVGHVGLFTQRQVLPDIFIRRSTGIVFGFSRLVGANTTAGLTYSPERTEIQAGEIYFCGSLGVCESSQISSLQRPANLAPVGLNLTKSTRLSAVDPQQGYTFNYTVEGAGTVTGSDYQYVRNLMDIAKYQKISTGLILAGHVKGGYIGAGIKPGLSGQDISNRRVVYPTKRFYAGGANSVRGFGLNRLGPKVLFVDPSVLINPPSTGASPYCSVADLSADDSHTILCDPNAVVDGKTLSDGRFDERPIGGTREFEGSLELRWAVKLHSLFFVAFTDFGQVWDANQPVSLHDLVFTPGIGMRYNWIIGPIRVDVGYDPSKGTNLPVVTYRLVPTTVGGTQVNSCSAPLDAQGSGTGPCYQRDRLTVLPNEREFGANRNFLHRLTFQISIGQPF